MQNVQHPEWLTQMLLQIGDPFGRVLWEAMYAAEDCYVHADFAQQHSLDQRYGQTQQKVIEGMVREAMRWQGMELLNSSAFQQRQTDSFRIKDLSVQELLQKIKEAAPE